MGVVFIKWRNNYIRRSYITFSLGAPTIIITIIVINDGREDKDARLFFALAIVQPTSTTINYVALRDKRFAVEHLWARCLLIASARASQAQGQRSECHTARTSESAQWEEMRVKKKMWFNGERKIRGGCAREGGLYNCMGDNPFVQRESICSQVLRLAMRARSAKCCILSSTINNV